MDGTGGCLGTSATPKRVLIITLLQANASAHDRTFWPQARPITTRDVTWTIHVT